MISNVKVYDLEESIIASGYPMIDNLDSLDDEMVDLKYWLLIDDEGEENKHFKRITKLANTEQGSGHNQALTGIRVAFDLTFSNKAWVELERYRFLEFVSSQSTMHRIAKLNIKEQCNEYVWDSTIRNLELKVTEYNSLKNKTSDYAKELYLEILYNVPSGFKLTARLTTNYRALKTVYFQRKTHRLPEWRDFCKWIESLPYAKELITGKE